jgi:hypothetical protein
MAQAVQFPGMIGRVALVIRGRMGVGKGEFAQHFGKLFGPNFIPVTKPDHITGKFNAHMGQCIVLFADEAFVAGEKAHESILKTLVTERTWMIEFKGYDAHKSPSCLHIILSSNEDWTVPTNADDRRFCIVDCGDAQIQNSEYFASIRKQMSSGGYEALLYHLLYEVDLAGFNAEGFPRTEEHGRQRSLSLNGFDSVIKYLCETGCLPRQRPGHANAVRTDGDRARGEGFWNWVRENFPDLKSKGSEKLAAELRRWECRIWESGTRGGYTFPTLSALRAAFEKIHGPQQWPERAEWAADLPGADGPLPREGGDHIPF